MPENLDDSENSAPDCLRATIDDVLAVDIEEPLIGSNEADPYIISIKYSTATELLKDHNNPIFRSKYYTYMMLSALMGMHFQPNKPTEPFGPMSVLGDGRRSAIPSDFTHKTDTIAALADKAQNAVLKARLSDICWLLDRRRPAYGFSAVSTYVDIVEKIESDQLHFHDRNDNGALFYFCREILLRALQIGHTIGRDKAETRRAREVVARLRRECAPKNDSIELCRFSLLDLDYKISNPEEIGIDIDQFISREIKEVNYFSRIELWRVAARAFSAAKKIEDRDRCLSEAAETLVKIASDNKGSPILESHYTSEAIAQIGRIPEQKKRRNELRHRLIDVQSGIIDEMQSYQHEIDIAEILDANERLFDGRSLIEQLMIFASASKSPSPHSLKEEAIKQIEAYPLSSLFNASHMDRDGKVIHRTPGASLHESDQTEAINTKIHQNERLRRSLVVKSAIEPMRNWLSDQHYIDKPALAALLRHSPFIPNNLLDTYTNAYLYFFQGDYIASIYIITPILESSLRYVLRSHGHDVTIFDDATQTQEDRSITSLYNQMRAELDDTFGINITDDIKRLYLEPPGPQLRHSVAHGLLSDWDPFSPDAIYACWLSFRLSMMPLFPHLEELREQLQGTPLFNVGRRPEER